MIQRQLKLKLVGQQESSHCYLLPALTAIWTWGCRKVEQNATGRISRTPDGFRNPSPFAGKTLNTPSQASRGMLSRAYLSWHCVLKKMAKRLRLKGNFNRLTSLPCPDPTGAPADDRRNVPSLGMACHPGQSRPEGRIRCGYIVRRAFKAFLSLFFGTRPNAIPLTADGAIGSYPGYSGSSTGERPEQLTQLQKGSVGQVPRGDDQRHAAALQERTSNRRRDRGHKPSRRLVAGNTLIPYSKENIRGLTRAGFGKSVAALGELRSMPACTCRAGGRHDFEVPGNRCTRTCSDCGAGTGPAAMGGVSARCWSCTASGMPGDPGSYAALKGLRVALATSAEGAF